MHEYADQDNPTKAVIYGETAETFKVGGYGVVFGGADIEGETFTPETDFWLDRMSRDVPVLYQHGKEARTGFEVIGKGHIDDPDDFGLWVETQIALADKYAGFVRKLAADGKLGYSSGTAGHLTRRDGKTIKSWPIVEMSLTPTPAEPRTLGVSEIRSLTEWADGLLELLPKTEGDSVATDEPAGTTVTIDGPIESVQVKEIPMTEEIKAPAPLTAERVAEIVQGIVSKAMADAPAMQKAMVDTPEGKDHAEDKSFADFLVAVARNDDKRIKSVYKTALAEDAGATGGYLVPTEYANSVLQIAQKQSVVRSAGPTVVQMGAREIQYPALDHTTTTAGTFARLGGVVASWTDEADALAETEPAFRNVRLVSHKLGGFSYVSNEVLDDSGVSLSTMLTNLFGAAIAAYEDWAFFNGDGVAQPLGVLKAPCLVNEVAASSTFILADATAMMEMFLSREPNGGVWFMHPKVLSKLIALVDAGSHILWPADATLPMPMRLFGKPIVFTDAMPVMPAGTSATQIGGVLLADWSYYLIGDRGGLSIGASRDYRYIYDQTTWRFTKRVAGMPWLNTYVTLADGSTTQSPFVSLKGA